MHYVSLETWLVKPRHGATARASAARERRDSAFGLSMWESEFQGVSRDV
jgi:hypothetical protein